MSDQIRLWQISKDKLNEITESKLDLRIAFGNLAR